jgi:hypothetical protein
VGLTLDSVEEILTKCGYIGRRDGDGSSVACRFGVNDEIIVP